MDFTLTPIFTPGAANTLADFCSRSFALSPKEFSEAVHSQFPTPGGWNIVPPPNEVALSMISALSRKMLP